MKVTPAKILWLALAFVCLALGTIGVFLPVLPTVPFYLLTAFAFAKSSERLHNWFTNTELYKKNLASFVEHKSMTPRTKLSILCSVTAVMALGIFFMLRKGLWIPCIILALVWLCHVLYFLFRVKTKVSQPSANKIEKKRKKEEYIVTEMIRLYCRKKHTGTKELCPECKALAEYAAERSRHCPNMANKTFCSSCTTHCYKSDMREKIRSVMRFSGPRIILHHPILAVWHLICSKRKTK